MDKSSEYKVLELIFEHPTGKFHIREMARLVKINPNTVLNVVKELEKEKIILIEKKKHIVEVFGNIEDKRFIRKKRIFNLSKIYGSGIVDFLIGETGAEMVSLIGSYSRGEDIEKSDIDIVVIAKKKVSELNLEKFEKLLKRKIHLLILDYSKMSDEFYSNLINGIVLHGFVRKK